MDAGHLASPDRAGAQAFARDQHSGARDEPRAMVRTAAYLFGGLTDLRAVGIDRHAFPTACTIFGRDLVEQQLQRVIAILADDGYSAGPSATASLRGTLSLTFLLSRSPYLEHISMDTVCRLTAGLQGAALAQMRSRAHKVARALWALDLIDAEAYARLPYATGNPQPQRQVDGIDPTWVAWAAAWYETARGLCASTRNAHYVHRVAQCQEHAAGDPSHAQSTWKSPVRCHVDPRVRRCDPT